MAALVLVGLEGGWDGLARFLRRSLNPRVGWRWFAIAALIPPAMALTLVGLQAAAGHAPPLAALGAWHTHVAAFVVGTSGGLASSGALQGLAHLSSQGPAAAALVVIGLALANGGVSEEAGWRGYAMAALAPGRRALTAALIVGVMWGLWHTGPVFWTGVFRSDWRVLAIPVEYTLGAIPLAVMIGWVFLRANGSLLPGMVFHASYNSTYLFLTALWTPGRPVVSVLAWLAATYVAAALVAAIGRRTLLGRASAAESRPLVQVA